MDDYKETVSSGLHRAIDRDYDSLHTQVRHNPSMEEGGRQKVPPTAFDSWWEKER